MSVYPGDYDTFTDPQASDPGSSPSRAATARKVNDSLRELEQTAGLNPQGPYATVAARLDAIEGG